MEPHADCHQCCAIGRCHFCGGLGYMEARFEKDGVQYPIRLCGVHFTWAASSKYAPPIIFDDCEMVAGAPPEVRQSDVFQNATLNLALLGR